MVNETPKQLINALEVLSDESTIGEDKELVSDILELIHQNKPVNNFKIKQVNQMINDLINSFGKEHEDIKSMLKQKCLVDLGEITTAPRKKPVDPVLDSAQSIMQRIRNRKDDL